MGKSCSYTLLRLPPLANQPHFRLMYRNTSLYPHSPFWELQTGQRTTKMSNVIEGKALNQLSNPTRSPLTSTYSPLWLALVSRALLTRAAWSCRTDRPHHPGLLFSHNGSQVLSRLDCSVLKRMVKYCTSVWTGKTNPLEFLQIYTGAFCRNPLTFTVARMKEVQWIDLSRLVGNHWASANRIQLCLMAEQPWPKPSTLFPCCSLSLSKGIQLIQLCDPGPVTQSIGITNWFLSVQ